MKEIVQDGTPVLRDIAQSIPEELFGTAQLVQLVEEMKAALDPEIEGVALAAPQIGISSRIFIVRKDRTLPLPAAGEAKSPPPLPEVEVYINPEIVKTSRKTAPMDEGCLSVRGVYGTAKRHERVTIKARGVDGSHIMRGAGGLMAQIFEHEIDHLNGILFTDHAERLIRIPRGPQSSFVYFGTPSVASETLETLITHGYVPVLVVTSPDAPKGRGLTLTPSPTKQIALSHGIPVITPESLDEKTVAALQKLECDYALCVAYGKIFPEALINTFPKGVLNVHYSLLPKYRGATPLETALLNGEAETGVTVQKMAKELDAGDIIAQETTDIEETETARELRPRLIAMGADLLVRTIPEYLSGDLVPIPQDPSQATRAYKIKKEDGELSMSASGEENWNKYRAYADSVGTYFFENGKRIRITQASFVKGKFVVERVIPEGKKETAYKTNA
jgi:methionyl-tRNA formyltransferase